MESSGSSEQVVKDAADAQVEGTVVAEGEREDVDEEYEVDIPTSKEVRNGRRLCGRITRTSGLPCRSTAGTGTVHFGYGACNVHGGSSPRAIIGAQREAAQAALVELGHPQAVHPIQALLSLVQESAGNVAFYRNKLQSLGVDLLQVDKYHKTETIRPWVHLYNIERDRLAKYSKLCIDIGFSERLVLLQEKQTEVIVQIAKAIAHELSGSPEDERRALTIASRTLRLVHAEMQGAGRVPIIDIDANVERDTPATTPATTDKGNSVLPPRGTAESVIVDIGERPGGKMSMSDSPFSSSGAA